MANKRIDLPTGTETVGHEWDGIEELDTPMPRWWLYTFYATILFAAACTGVQACDVSIGVSVAGEVAPGVYGRVDIGNARRT